MQVGLAGPYPTSGSASTLERGVVEAQRSREMAPVLTPNRSCALSRRRGRKRGCRMPCLRAEPQGPGKICRRYAADSGEAPKGLRHRAWGASPRVGVTQETEAPKGRRAPGLAVAPSGLWTLFPPPFLGLTPQALCLRPFRAPSRRNLVTIQLSGENLDGGPAQGHQSPCPSAPFLLTSSHREERPPVQNKR